MRLTAFVVAATLGLISVVAKADVTEENFVLRTVGDLCALCSVSADDPKAIAAIHFCHGYSLGLDHYGEATGRVFRNRLYCPPPDMHLTRDESVAMFVGWCRENAQHMEEAPIDGLIRWAMDTWPCDKPAEK